MFKGTNKTIIGLFVGENSVLADDLLAQDELEDFLVEQEAEPGIGDGDGFLSPSEFEGMIAGDAFGHLFEGLYDPSIAADFRRETIQNIRQRFNPSGGGVSSSSSENILSEAISKEMIPGETAEDNFTANDPLTPLLIDEILHNTQGIDRNLLVALCEEQARNLVALGQNDKVSMLYENLSSLYMELNDRSEATFSVARARLFSGDLHSARKTLRSLPADSPFTSQSAELIEIVSQLIRQEEKLQRILPMVAALEQMRMRALEQLGFDGSQIEGDPLKPNSWERAEENFNNGLIAKVNQGIDEMIKALAYGKIKTIEEGFGNFHTFTQIKKIPQNTPCDGRWFRNLLNKTANVDVDALMALSHITDDGEREKALLAYTEHLRGSPVLSLRGTPDYTVLANLEALQESQDPATQQRAKVLYRKATGEASLTGFSDAQYHALLREGAKSTVPMVLAMMAAGPAGAYVEGTVAATRITSAGKIIWTGANTLGKAGWIARGVGFAAESTIFWAANNTAHALLIGNGDNFTKHGLASSFLMLGGLRVLKKAWQATGTRYLTQVAKTAPKLSVPIVVINKAGQLGTELAGFWGMGQFEELIQLTPKQDTNLRQELSQAAIILMQLKVAVAAGNSITNHLATIKTLEIKLDTAQRLFRQAVERGELTAQQLTEAIGEITGIQAVLSQLQGLQPAYAMAGVRGGGGLPTMLPVSALPPPHSAFLPALPDIFHPDRKPRVIVVSNTLKDPSSHQVQRLPPDILHRLKVGEPVQLSSDLIEEAVENEPHIVLKFGNGHYEIKNKLNSSIILIDPNPKRKPMKLSPGTTQEAARGTLIYPEGNVSQPKGNPLILENPRLDPGTIPPPPKGEPIRTVNPAPADVPATSSAAPPPAPKPVQSAPVAPRWLASVVPTRDPLIRHYPTGSWGETIILSPTGHRSMHESTATFISDAEIIGVITTPDCYDKKIDWLHYGKTPKGKNVLKQVGWRGCVVACTTMLAMDHGKVPNLRSLAEGDLSDATSAITSLSTYGLRGEIYPIPRLEKSTTIETLINQYGSIQVSIGGEIGGHDIIIDEFSVANNTATIRDPYHGWSIQTTAIAILDRNPSQAIAIHR